MRRTGSVIEDVRVALVRCEPCLSWVMLVCLALTAAALVGAVHTRAPLVIAPAALGLALSVTGFAVLVVREDRRHTGLPRHVPWRARDWTRFEAQFWRYVAERPSDTPPTPR